MADAVIDACCLIDLLSSGIVGPILRAGEHTWHVPSAVRAEVQFIRQPDPNDPGVLVSIPADLTGLIAAGTLIDCGVETDEEASLYVHYASIFRSDGESMCLAVAKHRGWAMATDDRRAIRFARDAGLSVVSTPELVKSWADASKAGRDEIRQVLNNIELFARFRPNPSMPECRWWTKHLS
jgi:hypothetical protein